MANTYGPQSDNPFFDGTAFVAGFPIKRGVCVYLVTARHVLKELNESPAVFLNLRNGGRIAKPLDASMWRFHPTDASADVAVMPIEYDSALDVAFVHTDEFLKTEEDLRRFEVGPGDDVFFPGLFDAASGEKRITPLLRQGNLALLPQQSIQIETDVYLIEARSIKGISGSPVFIRQTVLFGATSQKDNKPVKVHALGNFAFLGLMQGHWDVLESELNKVPVEHNRKGVNLGIAIVVPAGKIFETLMHPDFVRQREQIEDAVAKTKIPQSDSGASQVLSVPREEFKRRVTQNAALSEGKVNGETEQKHCN